MKVKQLLKHFWHGASDIETVEIRRMSDLLVELGDDRLSDGDYGGFDNESVSIFLVEGNKLKVWVK